MPDLTGPVPTEPQIPIAAPAPSTPAYTQIDFEMSGDFKQRDKQISSSASWFYIIAGLSVLNTIIAFFHGHWVFSFGLGFTQLIDIIAVKHSSSNLAMYGTFLTILIGILYAMFGYYATKRYQSMFVIGIIFYALDAGLCLLVGEYVLTAFHGWVLYRISQGMIACFQLNKAAVERGFDIVG